MTWRFDVGAVVPKPTRPAPEVASATFDPSIRVMMFDVGARPVTQSLAFTELGVDPTVKVLALENPPTQ